MILSGTPVAEEIQKQLHHEIATLGAHPGFAAVLIGNNPASHSYVSAKKRASEKVGIRAFIHHLPETTEESKLLELIYTLNKDPQIDGIIIQQPLPKQMRTSSIIEAIHPDKDVDGFHPLNMGKLLSGEAGGFVPCTPLGIKVLLEKYKIPVSQKHVVIVGRSAIVGKPLAALLLQNQPGCNATVTVVHRATQNLKALTQMADILIVAIGVPHFIKADMVKKGVVIVDVGINRFDDPQTPKGYRIVGDVDFEAVEKKCSAITPVPKGVGPMTVAMLLHNTFLSYKRRHL